MINLRLICDCSFVNINGRVSLQRACFLANKPADPSVTAKSVGRDVIFSDREFPGNNKEQQKMNDLTGHEQQKRRCLHVHLEVLDAEISQLVLVICFR